MTDDVETIQEGEGGVSAGDIDLLYEDADNVLKGLVSTASRLKFEMYKLRQRLQNLQERLEWHYNGPSQVSGASAQVPPVGGGHGKGGTSGRALRQQLTLDDATGPGAGTKAEAPAAGKAFSSKKKEGT